MSTFVPSGKDRKVTFRVVDARDQRLGRLASEVAILLMGKDNPQYIPFLDMGSHVIVINARHIKLTGNKRETKVYHRYTGFPGGLVSQSFAVKQSRSPAKVIEEAIKGMLPKTKLGRKMGSKLRVYNDDFQPHAAQRPVPYECEAIELADFNVFYERLLREHRRWLASRSYAAGQPQAVYVGSERYTATEMLSHLESKNADGMRFAREMYQIQFGRTQRRANKQ
jgi:large subunit ribosomal protein L13